MIIVCSFSILASWCSREVSYLSAKPFRQIACSYLDTAKKRFCRHPCPVLCKEQARRKASRSYFVRGKQHQYFRQSPSSRSSFRLSNSLQHWGLPCSCTSRTCWEESWSEVVDMVLHDTFTAWSHNATIHRCMPCPRDCRSKWCPNHTLVSRDTVQVPTVQWYALEILQRCAEDTSNRRCTRFYRYAPMTWPRMSNNAAGLQATSWRDVAGCDLRFASVVGPGAGASRFPLKMPACKLNYSFDPIVCQCQAHRTLFPYICFHGQAMHLHQPHDWEIVVIHCRVLKSEICLCTIRLGGDHIAFAFESCKHCGWQILVQLFNWIVYCSCSDSSPF